MSRHHYRRKKETPDLELTTFLNLMVVLISFLLVTAVFSRISVQELKLPTAAAGGATLDEELVTIEVIVRKTGIAMGNGKEIGAITPKNGDQYDVSDLSARLDDLKSQYPKKTDVTLLVEPDIEYQDVIKVMDAIKVVRVPQPGAQPLKRILFPDVSVGDAP